MKITRLKTRSLKKQREIEDTQAERLAFRREMETCCLCDTPPGTVHEIYGAALRPRTVRDRCFWLACCWDCHLNKLQDMHKITQFAIKLHVDSDWLRLGHIDAVTGCEHRFDDIYDEWKLLLKRGVLKARTVAEEQEAKP